VSSDLPDKLLAIRDALIEVIEGQSGAVRTVEQGRFKFDELISHPVAKQQRDAADTSYGANRFDLRVISRRFNESTPATALGDRALVNVTFRIDFVRYVQARSTIEPGTSIDAAFAMEGELTDVEQALCWSGGDGRGNSGNLAMTLDGRETGIPSGCIGAVAEPETTAVEHDLDNHLMRASMTIVAVVQIVRSVEAA
jgi:hypothetical protein